MFDYHTHTEFSSDALSPMATMAEAALRAGLEGIAFTEHMEWMPADGAFGYLKPRTYFAELEALRARYNGSLKLLAGIEAGNPHCFPDVAHAMLTDWPWDIVLGSMHWVNDRPGWELPAFENGVEAAYTRYFEELARMAVESEYDVLAHFDIVRRDSWSLLRRVLPLDDYAEQVRQILRSVVARGKGLEINVSSWRKGMPDPLPGLTVLRWYRELGGEILVVGSDAHQPEHVGEYFDRACGLAVQAGFTRLARFERRRVVGWTAL